MFNEAKRGAGPDAVRHQMTRVLASADFDASDRNRRFLKYVVDETLEGRADRVKAYTIATTVFGRDASFDPQIDSIVRIEAGRLRRSLERYYLTAGAKDPVRIEIPRGSYVPDFEATDASATDLPPPAEATNSKRSGRNGRALLVMTFEEDGDPSAWRGFTRGFTRQLIVGLTRFTDLFVFGQHAPLGHAGPTDTASRVAAFDIEYLLTGGTTVSADRFSVEALLIDARTGQHIWAGSFERNLQTHDAATVRDEIANGIARTLAQPYGVIFSTIARHTDETPPEDLGSYDRVIQFYQYWRSYDRTLFEPVRAGLEQAIVNDPDYAEAFACLSQMYSNAFRLRPDGRGRTPPPLQRALALARRAIELAPSASRGHHALALALWFAGDVSGALVALESSHALNPNDTDVMADLGLRYALRATWDKAVPLLEEAFARNPAESSIYRIGLSLHHYVNGRYDEALAQAHQIEAPHIVYGYIMIAIAAAQLGLQHEAEAGVKAILTIDPAYGAHRTRDLKAHNLHDDLIEVVVEGLRKAGLPRCNAEAAEGVMPALRVI